MFPSLRPLARQIWNFLLERSSEMALMSTHKFNMTSHPAIHVRLGPRSYPILVGDGILTDSLIKHPLLSAQTRRAFVITDSSVKTVAGRIASRLGRRCAGLSALRGSESTKCLATLSSLYSSAARARLDRHSVVIAVGGGVIGDVAGFFAATWLRGIAIVHVPTTLVAQVDSAIGGKTGVNLTNGKNLVGAFHQPSLVVVDPTTLRTLPDREFRSGLAEVIKYSVIADAVLFEHLEHHLGKILRRDLSELSWVIRRCCAIKARVVSRDEYETNGLRAILNFGHTMGHAIEAAARYTLLHGEAIAIGMVAATRLSQKISGLSTFSAHRIFDLIRRAGLPTRLKRNLSFPSILAAMKLDKKAVDGRIRFVLARRIGSVQAGIPVSQHLIRKAVDGLKGV